MRAYCTTRSGGVSAGPWSSLNLGLRCGDDPSNVTENRTRLNSVLPAGPQWLRQVHGSSVIQHRGEPGNEPQADALVSFEPGRVCAVLTADCLPVFFCNRSGDRVGVAHAGWRGLARGILQATVRAMKEKPADLMAWMGPAIGPEAYEVGGDVIAAFPGEYPAGFRKKGDRWLMDLYALARIKLAEAGIRSVSGGGFCTLTERERFFSYRRDGVSGRMASLIWFE